jgi:hypothetical protein
MEFAVQIIHLLQRPEWIVFPGAYALMSLLPVCVWTFIASRRVSVGQLGQ